MRILLIFWCCWFYDAVRADEFEIVRNENRQTMFGDVLEPVYLIEWNGSFDEAQIVKIFHEWQSKTVLTLSSTNPDDYRKAMPCFPGPNIYNSSSQFLPRIPTCPTFVNYSLSTLGEAKDFISTTVSSLGNGADSTSTLANITESLKIRLESLQEYIPNGDTRNQLESLLNTLQTSNLTKLINGIVPCLLSSSSLDMSILVNFNKSQKIADFLCQNLQLCTFSQLVSGSSCFTNITESEYSIIGNLSIGSIIGDVSDFSISNLLRRKRTTSSGEDHDYTDDPTLNFTNFSFSNEEEDFEEFSGFPIEENSTIIPFFGESTGGFSDDVTHDF